MDEARKKTDKILEQMEKKVDEIYKEAYSGISEKWDKFMDSHYPKLDRAAKELEKAKKSGDRAAIKEAEDLYQRTAKNIVVNNRRFTSMANETAAKISHTNEVALSYVNDQMPEVYTLNYNAFGDQTIKGYSFALVNEEAVKNLAKSDKTLLPKKKIDIPKDMQWNKKLINSQMMQGILQGENITKMAKRLQNVTDMNRKSAIRNARTMTTCAENKGRQDSFTKATEDGVVMTREWIAAHDGRTRDWHVELDGVEVGVDEAWVNEYGEIMYPGDDGADPANVYNCRCAMRAHVKGFKWNQKQEFAGYDKTGILSDDSISELDSRVKSSVSNTIAKLNNEYPVIKKYLETSGTQYQRLYNDDKHGIMSTETEVRKGKLVTKKLVFNDGGKNEKIYSSLDNMKEYVMKEQGEWFMPCAKDKAADYLPTHEYGHIIQDYILNKNYNWKDIPKDKLQETYRERCLEVYKDLVKCGKKNGTIKDMDSAVEELSQYALKQVGKNHNTSDVFAESFANSKCGSPNSWGKTMEFYLKEKGVKE